MKRSSVSPIKSAPSLLLLSQTEKFLRMNKNRNQTIMDDIMGITSSSVTSLLPSSSSQFGGDGGTQPPSSVCEISLPPPPPHRPPANWDNGSLDATPKFITHAEWGEDSSRKTNDLTAVVNISSLTHFDQLEVDGTKPIYFEESFMFINQQAPCDQRGESSAADEQISHSNIQRAQKKRVSFCPPVVHCYEQEDNPRRTSHSPNLRNPNSTTTSIIKKHSLTSILPLETPSQNQSSLHPDQQSLLAASASQGAPVIANNRIDKQTQMNESERSSKQQSEAENDSSSNILRNNPFQFHAGNHSVAATTTTTTNLFKRNLSSSCFLVAQTSANQQLDCHQMTNPPAAAMAGIPKKVMKPSSSEVLLGKSNMSTQKCTTLNGPSRTKTPIKLPINENSNKVQQNEPPFIKRLTSPDRRSINYYSGSVQQQQQQHIPEHVLDTQPLKRPIKTSLHTSFPQVTLTPPRASYQIKKSQQLTPPSSSNSSSNSTHRSASPTQQKLNPSTTAVVVEEYLFNKNSPNNNNTHATVASKQPIYQPTQLPPPPQVCSISLIGQLPLRLNDSYSNQQQQQQPTDRSLAKSESIREYDDVVKGCQSTSARSSASQVAPPTSYEAIVWEQLAAGKGAKKDNEYQHQQDQQPKQQLQSTYQYSSYPAFTTTPPNLSIMEAPLTPGAIPSNTVRSISECWREVKSSILSEYIPPPPPSPPLPSPPPAQQQFINMPLVTERHARENFVPTISDISPIASLSGGAATKAIEEFSRTIESQFKLMPLKSSTVSSSTVNLKPSPMPIIGGNTYKTSKKTPLISPASCTNIIGGGGFSHLPSPVTTTTAIITASTKVFLDSSLEEKANAAMTTCQVQGNGRNAPVILSHVTRRLDSQRFFQRFGKDSSDFPSQPTTSVMASLGLFSDEVEKVSRVKQGGGGEQVLLPSRYTRSSKKDNKSSGSFQSFAHLSKSSTLIALNDPITSLNGSSSYPVQTNITPQRNRVSMQSTHNLSLHSSFNETRYRYSTPPPLNPSNSSQANGKATNIINSPSHYFKLNEDFNTKNHTDSHFSYYQLTTDKEHRQPQRLQHQQQPSIRTPTVIFDSITYA